MSSQIKELARWFGADLVGIAALPAAHPPPGGQTDAGGTSPEATDPSASGARQSPFAIVCAIAADYDPRQAQGLGGQLAVQNGAVVNHHLRNYIRELGYRASIGGIDPVVVAAAAGLGRLESSGRLVTSRRGGQTGCLTNASGPQPWRPCADEDDRRLIEHGGRKATKPPWDLGHPPPTTARAVRVPGVCTRRMVALATGSRWRCAQEATGGAPVGWHRGRRHLLQQTRDPVMVCAHGDDGLCHLAAYALWLGVRLKATPPGIGTRQAMLATYRLTTRRSWLYWNLRKKLLPTLDIGSHINARHEPLPKAGAERTL